jgi:hypothetical protein
MAAHFALKKQFLSCKDFIFIVLNFEENFWLCFKFDKNLQLQFWIFFSNIKLDFVV